MKKNYLMTTLMLIICCAFGGCGKADNEDIGEKVTTASNVETTTVVEETTIESVTEEVTTEALIEAQDSKTPEALYKLSINGYKISLPCTYKDLKDAGFDFEDSNKAEDVLNPTYINTGTTMINSNNESIVVVFTNNTDKTIKYREGTVTSFYAYETLDNAPNIVLNNGITFGTSLEDVKKVLGDADLQNEVAGLHSLSYYVVKDEHSSGKIEFVFKEDKVCQITIIV